LGGCPQNAAIVAAVCPEPPGGKGAGPGPSWVGLLGWERRDQNPIIKQRSETERQAGAARRSPAPELFTLLPGGGELRRAPAMERSGNKSLPAGGTLSHYTTSYRHTPANLAKTASPRPNTPRFAKETPTTRPSSDGRLFARDCAALTKQPVLQKAGRSGPTNTMTLRFATELTTQPGVALTQWSLPAQESFNQSQERAYRRTQEGVPRSKERRSPPLRSVTFES
jgi:hypothetical protein